jgi:hypothetical protein
VGAAENVTAVRATSRRLAADTELPIRRDDERMGLEFVDLPEWEFTVTEKSAGIYEIRAVRNGGIHGESTGANYDALLDDLKDWARQVDADLARP